MTKFTDLQRNLPAGIVTWPSEGEGLGLEKELYSVSLNQNRGREGRMGQGVKGEGGKETWTYMSSWSL